MTARRLRAFPLAPLPVRRRRALGRCTVAMSTALLLALPGPAMPAAASPLRDAATPASATPCPSRPAPQPEHLPVFAHFYIWFTTASWNRAKSDYPAIGRYSSDDATVMQRQVAEARAAGIDGFIVSWKSTPQLDARLATLRAIAAAQHFKLALTYQGEDFDRNPLPPDRVRADLQKFAATYARDPVFDVLGSRPLVALTGTENYTAGQLRSIVRPVASRLTVLATEKSVTGYERVASLVDGELYYWSSGDPLSTPRYAQKLRAMANAVRARCGLWVAPVAPGFDARKIGGRTVVPRRNGATLRASWQAAIATTPDLLGVISWNEYSESTYVEPSRDDGARYLDVLGELIASPAPPPKELDSNGPQGPGEAVWAVVAFSVIGASAAAVTAVGMHRRRTSGA